MKYTEQLPSNMELYDKKMLVQRQFQIKDAKYYYLNKKV